MTLHEHIRQKLTEHRPWFIGILVGATVDLVFDELREAVAEIDDIPAAGLLDGEWATCRSCGILSLVDANSPHDALGLIEPHCSECAEHA